MRRFFRIAGRAALVLIALVLAVILIGPFLVPLPEPVQGRPLEQLRDPDSQFVRLNGLDVHLKQMGSGEPVFILLHGFASGTFTWGQTMPEFARLGTAIAWDRPAFGLTERPLEWQGENPYSPESQLKIVDELLDRTGSRQAILVGNSAGGTLALEYARTRPDRVQALILTSPAVYTGGGAPEWIKPILGSPQMRRIGPAIVRAAFEELARSGQGFTGAWYDASRAGPELRRAYGETLQVADWDRALFEFTLASRELGLPRVLAQIQQPTLVITGDSDRVVPTAESIRLAGELPNAQLLVIPQCGHVAQEECPAPMMEAVNRFLAGLR